MLRHHLEKLEHFTGVAKSGSIRSYASAHGLSQPAISKCIQNLETELEVSLFIRERTGTKLTHAGKKLLVYSEQTLAEADRIARALRSETTPRLSGHLVMGTYQSIAVYFVPQFFKFMRREQEELTLDAVSAPSEELVRMLKSGKADFILSIDPPALPQFSQFTILNDTFSLYKAAKFKEPLNKSLIFTLPMAHDRAGKSVMQYLKEANLDKRVSQCGDFESVKAMVEQGVGYGFMPDRVAKALFDSGKIDRESSLKKLNQVGEHSLVFSCAKHRASDVSLTWIGKQILRMLEES